MTERAELNDDFHDFLTSLTEQAVSFVIVGAYALAAHGIPRATGDIDIFVEPSADNAARLMRALEAFGAPTAAHGVQAADFATPGHVYQMGVPPRRIDVLTEIDGVSFERAARDALHVTVDGLRLPFLGRDALLENKRAAGRPKDLLDVETLLNFVPADADGDGDTLGLP
jgi:predicted nucleotidyltransferase